MTTMIRRYRADAFRQFQREAMRIRGGDMQLEILSAVRDRTGGDFVNWLENQIRQYADGNDIIIGDAEPTVPPEPEKYTTADFLQPPDPTSMWEAWRSITPGIACSPSVWAYIVTRLIIAGKIEPHYLVAETNGAKPDGRANIDAALRQSDEAVKAQKIDKCVRAFLRRLSGLLERGTRSVYENCPPARAWWQHYIARQAAQNTGCDETQAVTLLKSKGVWGALAEKMASRLTVIGDRNLRDGIVIFLLDENNAPFRKGPKLAPLFGDIGVMAAWRALGYFRPEQVKDMLAKEIAPRILSAPAGDGVKSNQ